MPSCQKAKIPKCQNAKIPKCQSAKYFYTLHFLNFRVFSFIMGHGCRAAGTNIVARGILVAEGKKKKEETNKKGTRLSYRVAAARKSWQS